MSKYGIDISHHQGYIDFSKLKDMVDYDFTFNYTETARVQEHHLMTYHLICEFVEKEMKYYYEETK